MSVGSLEYMLHENLQFIKLNLKLNRTYLTDTQYRQTVTSGCVNYQNWYH